MHPSYDIEEWKLLQDQDPEESLFHQEVVSLIPYIALAGTVLWLSDQEMIQLLQRDNKNLTKP